MISAIAVIGKNRELGNEQSLIWKVPGDLPRFKNITMGHPIIMGRKTYESIGRVLPGRANIIISRQKDLRISGGIVTESIEAAITAAIEQDGAKEIFVIGGGEIYRQALPLIKRLYLTIVDESEEADTYFPDYSEFVKIVSDEYKEVEGMKFRYLTLER